MDDWQGYRVARYESIIRHGQRGDFEDRWIAIRVQEHRTGIYETLKSYDNGVAYNDRSWLIYSTSRRERQDNKVIYKDKVFCPSKSKVIEDLYSYILFLRKIGIEAVYEMNYYAVAFLVKYLRFYEGVFNCTLENQKKIGELCRTVANKVPGEIDCASRKDSRQFALDPDETRKMNSGDIVRWQKRIIKQMTDEEIRKWYNARLSVRKNIEVLKEHGIEICVGRLHQWIKEYVR
ncbi:MAG: hypothetical protein J6T04_08630 [Bacteroidales bacterium]|nr:hypothetical protein [Bacteroidales bacterium]